MIRTAHRATALAAAALIVLPAALTAQDLSLDEVLARLYESAGGPDEWEQVRSMRMSGRMIVGQDVEAPFTMISKRPNKTRVEFTVQGMTGIQAFDGETAWMVMPFTGDSDPQRMPDAQAEAMRADADFDGLLVNWERQGHTIELAGRDQIDDRDVYTLDVTLSNGEARRVHIDAESFVPTRITGSRTAQGMELEFETVLDDYRPVGDLLIAHSVETRVIGAPGSEAMLIDSIELNIDVPDSVFEMPPPGM
ncbi:MAG: hypothetical protein ACODAE_10060 [Gemmatimonadota bacterium]